MSRRERILGISGVLIIAVAFICRSILLDATRVVFPEPPMWVSGYSKSSSKGPKVILGFESDWWRLKNAVRVDIRNGLPHTRDQDGMPIRDLVSYIDAEVAKTGAAYVLISISREEKHSSVIAIIDECRKTKIKAVVINQNFDAFAGN